VHSIYPTGSASIEHDTPLSGGNLGMGASVGTAPELDLTTAEVDPRLTVAAGIGWSKERFSIDAGVSSAVSLSQDLAGALNAFTASVTAAYDIGAGFAVDAGVRGAWQTFEGATAIPPSIAIFLGLSWGAGIPINH
jgi:hypothetical protein